MSTSPAVYTPAYQACLEEARTQAPLLAARWYNRLLLLLFEKSTAAAVVFDKNKMHDAWQALKKYQGDIEQGFALQIAQAIERELASQSGRGTGSSHGPMTSTTSALRFQDLELMGDEQVQDTLDEARLAQTLLLTSEAGLAGFSARLSTAQGFKVVKSDKNPLRPEVYAHALVHALQDLPVELSIRTRWLLHGGQIMGELLQAQYVQLDELLARLGVKPAGYGVVLSPDDPRRAGSDAIDPVSFPSGAGFASLAQSQHQDRAGDLRRDVSPAAILSDEQLLTLDQLHRLMSGDFNDALLGSANPDAGGEFGGDQRENGKRPAASLVQSLAAQVVGLMIGQLTADRRLLAPVRQLLGDMKPAFLRLGAADQSFFNNKNHPARGLLEAMTAKSLAFASEADEGFLAFMNDLQASTAQLIQKKAINSLDFATVLKGFEDRQGKRDQMAAKSQKLAVKALMQAEQRNLLAEKIAVEIRQRRDFVEENAIIAAFVSGPWAQVMANERLGVESEGSANRKAVFSLALGDLLWTANVAQASRYRKWLLKMIPSVNAAVRAGLLSIDYPMSLSKPFFEELTRLHEQALKSPLEEIDSARKKGKKQGDSAIPADASNSRPWLQSSEVKHSGFMDFPETQKPAQDERVAPDFQMDVGLSDAPAEASAGPSLVDHQDTQPMPGQDMPDLQLGIWIELLADRQWIRAQLSWISPHGTLLMFTSGGGRCHSMTASRLKDLLEQGRLRLISQQGLLDSALDGVAQAAMRNSVQARSGP